MGWSLMSRALTELVSTGHVQTGHMQTGMQRHSAAGPPWDSFPRRGEPRTTVPAGAVGLACPVLRHLSRGRPRADGS